MQQQYRIRRLVVALVVALISLSGLAFDMATQDVTFFDTPPAPGPLAERDDGGELAVDVLESLPVKGRAPKTGYSRAQFSNGWAQQGGCSVRNIILQRDLKGVKLNEQCQVEQGTLDDPYTAKTIEFVRGAQTSADVQIDHVVALSNAWQTGAQQLSAEQRHAFSNDPLNLIATQGAANQQKGDGDAATWLPSNRGFRCEYVARQIAVKKAYSLWLVPPEAVAMKQVLSRCPTQAMPVQ